MPVKTDSPSPKIFRLLCPVAEMTSFIYISLFVSMLDFGSLCSASVLGGIFAEWKKKKINKQDYFISLNK